MKVVNEELEKALGDDNEEKPEEVHENHTSPQALSEKSLTDQLKTLAPAPTSTPAPPKPAPAPVQTEATANLIAAAITHQMENKGGDVAQPKTPETQLPIAAHFTLKNDNPILPGPSP